MKISNIKLMKFSIFCTVISIILCLSGCKKTQKTKQIRLNETVRSLFYCAQYVALENKYFDNEGIEIVFYTANGSDKSMTSIISNQADIALLGPETVMYVKNENKIKDENSPMIFGQLTNCDGSFLIGYDENFLWRNLEGKTIITGRRGGLPEMCFMHLVKENNVDIDKIKFINNIQYDLMAPAFLKNIANYVTLFEPSVSVVVDKTGAKILKSLGEETGTLPYTCYVAKRSYLNTKTELVQKFINSVHKGQIWINDHSSEEISKLITPYFPSVSEEALAQSIERYKNIGAFANDPLIREESYERLLKILKESDESQEMFDMKDTVENSFAEKSLLLNERTKKLKIN